MENDVDGELMEALRGLAGEELIEWMFFKKMTANGYFKAKSYQLAIQTYKVALVPVTSSLLELREEDKQEIYYPVLMNIATCLYSMQQYSRALQYADRVIRERGNHSETYEKKGMILLKLGREGEAREAFQRSLNFSTDPKLLERVKLQIQRLQSQLQGSTAGSESGNEETHLIGKKWGSKGEAEEPEVLVYEQRNILKRAYELVRQRCGRLKLGSKWSSFKGYFPLFGDDD